MTARKKSEAPEVEAEETATAEAPAEETERQKRARLKTAATNQLIEVHRDEFNQIADDLFKANGLEFKRRLTDEEKAEQKLARLLEENPGLRGKLGNYAGEQHSGELHVTASADAFGTEPVEVEGSQAS